MNERSSSSTFSGEHESIEAQYTQAINRFARDFIYNDVDAATIEKQISDLRKNEQLAATEHERHELESLLELIKGIESHERANQIHTGAWQANIIRQRPTSPEQLSREDIEKAFNDFAFRDQLVADEASAIQHYETLLAHNENPTIAVSRNITLKKQDIEVLINDLQVRRTERNPLTTERKRELAKLDNQLREIIESLSDEDWGKRFELEEIYLLRRLIHSADTGHLVSVSHGTPREDLRTDRGSVDITMTAAGDSFGFQLKTFKRGVSKTAREQQDRVLNKTEHHLQGSDTNLVVLESESVKETYESAIRRSSTAAVKRSEAYETLQPLVDSLEDSSDNSGASERYRLIKLLGLTEEDLQAEKEIFQKKHEELLKLQETYRAKEKLEAEKIAEAERRRREAELAEEEAIRQKIEARIRLQEHDATQSETERQRIRAEKEARILEQQAIKEKERAELKRIADEREATKLAEEEKARKKEEAKKKKQEKLEGWPPIALTGLGNASTLQRIGLLAQDWGGQPNELMSAKKQFIQLFAKPVGKKPISETNKPNTLFAELFPTKESFENPTHEDRVRIQQHFDQSKAA